MKVRIINKEDVHVLVEWYEGTLPMRGSFPSHVVHEDGGEYSIPDEALSLAIPYGIDWAFLLEGAVGNVTPELFCECLRKAGMWTPENVMKNPAAVHGALMQAYSVDLQRILRLVKESGGNE